MFKAVDARPADRGPPAVLADRLCRFYAVRPFFRVAMAVLLSALMAMGPIGTAKAQTDSSPDADTVKATLKRGAELFQDGRASEAVALWQPLAERGHPGAQLNLAQAYRLGRGVERNLVRARELAQNSAEQGHAMGQLLFGLLLYTAEDGQAADRSAAVKWWHAAAVQGLGPAQYRLGVALWQGRDRKSVV